ncbi:hypothetical protein COO60DRAFT_223766 [Scenedesmus sp. NREL 46B-D3]|nr:hypothetical protein COO60DRAFT_223766 [Scenedesmus sp. NREL 46B-D3]
MLLQPTVWALCVNSDTVLCSSPDTAHANMRAYKTIVQTHNMNQQQQVQAHTLRLPLHHCFARKNVHKKPTQRQHSETGQERQRQQASDGIQLRRIHLLASACSHMKRSPHTDLLSTDNHHACSTTPSGSAQPGKTTTVSASPMQACQQPRLIRSSAPRNSVQGGHLVHRYKTLSSLTITI